jgi:putative replication protein
MICEHGKEIRPETVVPLQESCIECFNRKLAKYHQDNLERRYHTALITPKFMASRFENYEAKNDGQAKALNYCRDYAENFPLKHHDIVMIGGPGTGKDHLSAAMAKVIIGQGRRCLIMDAEKLHRQIKDNYKLKRPEQDIFDELAAIDFLIINEIGIKTTEAQAAVITEICNDRGNNLRPTGYVGNLSLAGLTDKLGERAIDRIVKKDKSNVIIFDWQSHRE